MPAYVQSVGYNPLPEVVVSGKPAYLFGALPTDTQDTLAQVTSVACASNVATIVCTIQQGNIPVVGNLITVQGTVTASGAYNVKQVAIASISGTASTGVYTITYACTTANLTTTADSGKAFVPIAETSETLAAVQSVAVYVPAQEPLNLGTKSITISTIYPTLPTAATVTLYTAVNNEGNGIAPGSAGSEWTAMGVVSTVAGSAVTAGPLQTYTVPAGRFFCVVVSGITGSGKIICKLLS